jgi:hypothetical protein
MAGSANVIYVTDDLINHAFKIRTLRQHHPPIPKSGEGPKAERAQVSLSVFCPSMLLFAPVYGLKTLELVSQRCPKPAIRMP